MRKITRTQFSFGRSTCLTVISALILTITCIISSKIARSAEDYTHPALSCESNVDSGTLYYDFDALFIVFTSYDVKQKDVLPILEYKNLRDLLVTSLKNNFRNCLKKRLNQPKPVVVFAPFSEDGKKSQIGEIKEDGNLSYETKYSWKDIHDPDNLTIVIRMSYPEAHSDERYGLLSYFIYRPEVSFLQMRLPQNNNSGSIAFFDKDGEDAVKSAFKKLFDSIRPREPRPPLNARP
ncbi:MAG: hypothetical protein ACAH80_04225 [Alphaproteobacteria bacterium]